MTEDAELLVAWRGGDASSGQVLFQRYFDHVSRFFINKVPYDHEDLIQETFAACVVGRDRLREDANFRSYLFGTAYNVLKRYFTKDASARKIDALESCAAFDLAPGPSTLMRTLEQDRLLLEALRRLPLGLQVVLEMRYWEDMSSADIGEAMGVSAATARTRTFRGREKLMELLRRTPGGPKSEEELDLEGWAQRIRALMD
ncbi:MAG: sigma-70 family RNA polymerase sigma factor [Myxococcota bacterium]